LAEPFCSSRIENSVYTRILNNASGSLVHKFLEMYFFQKPVGQGPLPEYDYWHEREAGLAVLAEELKSPMVVHIIEILQEGGSPVAEGFTRCQNDLLKCYMQARDNVKFLSTILRHFQVIIHQE
jgi:dynein heavy chain